MAGTEEKMTDFGLEKKTFSFYENHADELEEEMLVSIDSYIFVMCFEIRR